MRRLPLVLPVLLLAAALLTAPAAAARASFASSAVRCAWPVESTPTKANVAYPDANATYWTTPFVATPGMRITLKGAFPTARFFSINAYASDAQDFSVRGVGSSLTDYEIAPDAGTANPWVASGASAGTYTVILRRGVSKSAVNAIPIAPARPATPLVKGLPRRTGFVMVRVYLPDGGDPSTVPLPTVTYTYRSGRTVSLRPCRRAQTTPTAKSQIRSKLMRRAVQRLLRGTKAAPPAASSGACSDALVFCRAGGGTTPFPNSDSGYAAATFQPAPGYVTVVRATMPESAAVYGPGPGPWPASGIDLRYWSFCTYVYAKPYPVVKVGRRVGCVADEDMPVTAGNVATVAISSVRDRPAQTRGAGAQVGWLPTSAQKPKTKEVIAIRNMLAAPGFSQSVMNAQLSDPASAESVMGPYYPTIAQCTTAVFAQGGADGCFQNPSTPPS